MVNRNRLFILSCLGLITTSVSFAVRAQLETVFISEFELSSQDLGTAFAPVFLGLTITMIIGGALVDQLGMKRMVWLAFIFHIIGITITVFAFDFWSLFFGSLAIGVGNGMIEAACNPLIATIYSDNKTKMLNRFHIWFPGGIVIGSLLGYILIERASLPWQILVGIMYIPTILYGLLLVGQEFPKTERVQLGISTVSMWKTIISPLFLFMAFCMILTASTEIGTNQRISSLLEETGVSAILVLAFINGIMAIGRGFAGPVVKKLDTTGMLFFSAVFAFGGLIWLSYSSGAMTFLAAFIFAVGVCYFWPTMLGFISEKIPESGALGLSVMGGVGNFSISIALPIIGIFMDTESTGAETLRYMAVMPAILILAFGALFFLTRKKSNE
ncbi:MAG: MFS transporter [Cytophagales bacterium]|nr:MFS transporter [Cytophagales bacterium]